MTVDCALPAFATASEGSPTRPIAPRNPSQRRSAVDFEAVIPAYNEAARIANTLRQTAEYLEAQPWSSRIVVVDNGSADQTGALVQRVSAQKRGRVSIELVGCARPGKGAAVRRGLLSSTASYVGYFDADLATPLETIGIAMTHLRSGATAVIASRHSPGASFVKPQQLGRRAGGRAFRVLTRAMVPGVSDTQCGFKFFQRYAVTRALVQCRTSGFAFDVELLQRLQYDGGTIVELPVAWTDGVQSTFRPVRDGFATFGAVLQMHRV